MTFWTYQNLADLTQGQWLVAPDDPSAKLTGLWHDTRDIKPGQAYLAIKGENFDGHAFVDKAFEAGAALAIVQTNHQSSIINHQSTPILKVADTIVALQDLARAYRDELKAGGCKVIGIAGSNGKTTTRHLIHHVLTHAGLNGTQSPKSFNNHLGVPLTLLSGKPQDDFVACEIGTNHPGEIDFLSAIARPDIAVITSIGEEHLEFFKNVDGVAEEEFSICSHLPDHALVVTGDLGRYAGALKQRLLATTRLGAPGIGFDPPQSMPLVGRHNRMNASVALQVASELGIELETAQQALHSIQPAPHRGELIRFDRGVTVYDDCYNANPSSVREALSVLEEIGGSQAVFIFGDMFELGDAGPAAHRVVGEMAWGASLRRFVSIGSLSRDANADIHFEEFTDRTPDDVADLLQPGDTVLLKASRGMRLERLIPAIERRFGVAQDDQPT